MVWGELVRKDARAQEPPASPQWEEWITRLLRNARGRGFTPDLPRDFRGRYIFCPARSALNNAPKPSWLRPRSGVGVGVGVGVEGEGEGVGEPEGEGESEGEGKRKGSAACSCSCAGRGEVISAGMVVGAGCGEGTVRVS